MASDNSDTVSHDDGGVGSQQEVGRIAEFGYVPPHFAELANDRLAVNKAVNDAGSGGVQRVCESAA
jgi:hypothetical protein